MNFLNLLYFNVLFFHSEYCIENLKMNYLAIIIFLAFLASVLTLQIYKHSFQEQITEVNNMHTTWKAGINFGEHITNDYISSICGSLADKGWHNLKSKFFKIV